MVYSIGRTETGNYTVIKTTATGSYVIAIDEYHTNCNQFIRELEGNGKVKSNGI